MNKLLPLALILGFSLFVGCGKPTETTTPAESADDWPRKPVKIIVPFGPGGSTDQTVRVLQKAITDNELLPQRLTVINVSGHYSVGCRKALSEKADGYTFLAVHKGMMGGQATGITDFGHTDFEPVAETTSFSQVVTVRDDSPWTTLDELLEGAKTNAGDIIFGCNLGALNHMAGIILEEAKPGAKFNFVQIGGGAANFAALAGEHIQVTVLSTSEYLSFRSKGLRALAYTGPERHPAIAEVPTLKELGHDRTFTIGSWWFAPKGTPQAAIDGFAAAMEKAMQTDYVKEQCESRAMAQTFVTGEALQAKLDSEWKVVQTIATKMKTQAKE
jgi:tripartite-type tricarboxylate transporter receptor subunit TctC